MPIYIYETIPERDGERLRELELKQSVNDAPLTHDPATGEAIRKIIALPNVPRITQPVSHIDAKKAGFVTYKRISKGEYERQ